MPRWAAALGAIAITVSLHVSSMAEEPESWESSRGLFHVRYQSSTEPVEINRIQEWILHIEAADGVGVDNATLSITGGMPEHDHGLPTAPRVTENLGDGNYRVQGLRFHMAGEWLIEITIEANGRTDSVAINLTI